MSNEQPDGHEGGTKKKRSRATRPHSEPVPGELLINVERSGDWMPVEELREAALTVLDQGKDVVFDLDQVDHLDASALQILLALDTEQKRRSRNLQLANASPHFRKWLEFAGVEDRFSMVKPKTNE